MKKEFSARSPSPPAEDSEPEMTEEEKEIHLVSMMFERSFIFCPDTVIVDTAMSERFIDTNELSVFCFA